MARFLPRRGWARVVLPALIIGSSLFTATAATAGPGTSTTTPFTFSEFGLTPPRAPVVLSVADHGTIEFQLFFTKADA